jgi:hypothetical protein
MDVAGGCPHAGIRGRNHDFLDATAVETRSRAARLCEVGAAGYGVHATILSFIDPSKETSVAQFKPAMGL